jgi:hypothetical protein
MKKTAAFVLAAVLLALTTSLAVAYEVVPGHPRILFRAEDVEDLRTACNGIYAADYNRLKSWCDSQLSGGGWVAEDIHLPALSFVYLMSQDTRYLNRAKEIAQQVSDGGQSESWEWLSGGSYFFDWCYDGLTPAERQTYGTALAEAGDWMTRGTAIGTQWYQTNNYHSKVGRMAYLIFAGAALYDEGIADQTAAACIDTYLVHMEGPRHFLCCLQEVAGDGSYFEGDYNYSILVTGNRRSVSIWDTATYDQPYEFIGSYQNMARYLMYETGPMRGWSLLGSKQGDSHHHAIHSTAFRYALYDLARVYRDGAAQWMADEIDDVGAGSVYDYDLWRTLIWRDPTLDPVHPAEVYGEMAATRFDSVGTVYMRSGWDISSGSDDIYAVFRCETFPGYHTHAHQNHFLIARGGDLLAIDSGEYDAWGSSHHRNYFTRTVAHNTITVFDPSESFGSYANDGGQKPPFMYPDSGLRLCGDASEPENYRGRLAHIYRDTDAYTYARGDATSAYSADKVEEFTREFVWLKPDLFVILDRVRATSPSFKKRWLLHSLGEPAVAGDTTVIDEGDSKLYVKTLLPEAHEIVKVGGSGHEFEVNGVNYSPGGGVENDVGAWRIEVSPTNDAEEHLFLHVLYPCDDGVTAMPEANLIDSGDLVGVDVAGFTVLFSKTGETVEGGACWVTGN